MVVFKGLEHAAQHDVLKVVRAIVLQDKGLVREHETEVASLPGDSFVWADEAVDYAGDGSLVGLRCALDVEVHAEGQKKAELGWGGDVGLDGDELHLDLNGGWVKRI